MKHTITTENPQANYTLVLEATLEDAPDVPVNTWTKKIMQPQKVTVVYAGPSFRGEVIASSRVSVEGKRRKADGSLGTDEKLWAYGELDWLRPVLDNLRAVALDALASQLRFQSDVAVIEQA